VRFCCAEHGNKALSVDEKTGIIVVDTIMPRGSVCQECGWCMVACEFGAISLDPKTRIAIVCDLCPEEEEPPCVKYCPKDALSLATIEEAMQKTESETARKLLREFSQARKNPKTFYERLGFTPMTLRKLNEQARAK
jgi:Fe-S-cluster-containing hydrogenase component 2